MIPYSLIDQERINSNGIQPRSCTWFNESNESQSVPAGDNGELISSDRLTVNGDVLSHNVYVATFRRAIFNFVEFLCVCPVMIV